MGVKSTITLTRTEAETLYVNHKLERKRVKYARKASKLSNKAIEDTLEAWNDAEHDGSGFDNYLIIAG